MEKLHFSIVIQASAQKVWDTMLARESYRVWSAVFSEGSDYEGSWEKGAKIKFGDGTGNGMLSEIVDNQLHKFVSIRHYGEMKNGVEDTSSESVKAWTPAYENYTFTQQGNATQVDVDLDVPTSFVQFMNDTWPEALKKLKTLCQ
ncbi:SRPBCC domain-containing protein [Candidatus Gracilibacteria bacterium]|nr:SRPBCC domain-containing protein [Candidatus Gracilibacteria bacterium]